MISGAVNADIEAVIPLELIGSNEQRREVNGIVDTGFSGDVTLLRDVIDSLELTWLGREPGTLADGSTDLFDVYSALLVWDGESRPVEVEAAQTQPLVGMNLLHGYALFVEVIDRGRVQISSM